MKIIDQTPFYSEKTELTMSDRLKASMQFGMGWFKEMEAQKSIIPVLDKTLDRNFTLLHNVTPPELNFRIPFVLVGPTGVYVMDVTPLTGVYRAKGEQWGTTSGDNFKPQNPNLLTRTERLARAVLMYLQRQGINEVTTVEAALLGSDPGLTIDSQRPIIRVVQRDALERFAVSVAQAPVILGPDTVRLVIKRLTTATPKPEAQPETAAEEPTQAEPTNEANPYVPDFALPENERAASGSLLAGPVEAAGEKPLMPARRRRGLSRNQVTLLVIMFIFWCLTISAFIYLVVRDLS